MRIDGRCHCGAITYEAEVDPAQATICHCTDCQMLTGSAYRANVPAPAATFVLRSGTPKTYVKTTAESGAKRLHAFCPDCGSPVYSCDVIAPKSYSLRLGCIAQRAELVPTRRIWARSALPWSEDLAGIARVERQ
jgi:hypothetical protein